MDRLKSVSSGFAHQGYQFGGFRLEADGTLLHGEDQIHLHPQELAALRLLLANPGRILTSPEIKQALSGIEQATAESVSRCLASLRSKLDPEDCIHVVKRGYHFSVDVIPLVSSRSGLPRLAILPFTVEYGVPEYLGFSVAEEVSIRLGAGQPAFVTILARDSVFHLAGPGMTPQDIGHLLEADLVLSGSLRAMSSHYRLRVEMIDARDGRPMWVEDLLVERGRVAGLENELVDLVSSRMSTDAPSFAASATPAEESDQPTEQQASRREAYELFQQARFEWQTLERHRVQDALHNLLRSIEIDPDLSAARVEIAHLCTAQSLYGYMQPSWSADYLRRAAQPVAPEGMLPALGWIGFHVDRDLPTALRLFAQSEQLPYHPWNLRVRVHFTLARRRFSEAIEQLQAAIPIDPYHSWLHARLAWAHHMAGDAAASIQLIRAALERFPDSEPPLMYGTLILGHNGETAAAVELSRHLTRRLPHFDLATMAHAYALAVAGEAEAAHAILEHFEWLSRERYALKSFLPAIHLALGDSERALVELRAAEQSRCPWFFQMLADPRLKPLHGHPEFESMHGILAGMEAEAARSEPKR